MLTNCLKLMQICKLSNIMRGLYQKTLSTTMNVVYVSPTGTYSAVPTPITNLNSFRLDSDTKSYADMAHSLHTQYPNIKLYDRLLNAKETYEYHTNSVVKIDNKLKKTNNQSSKSIYIHSQNSQKMDIPVNIKKYIEPLLVTNWNPVMLDIFSRMWATLIQNGKVSSRSNFIEQLCIDHNNGVSWMTNKNSWNKCPHTFMTPYVSQWSADTDTNFIEPIRILEQSRLLRVTDYSLANKRLIDYRENLMNNNLKQSKQQFVDSLYMFIKLVNIQRNIKLYGFDTTIKSIEPFNFNIIYSDVFNELHRVLDKSEYGVNWLVDDMGSTINLDNDIGRIVKKIYSYKIGDNNVIPVLLQLQYAYRYGWTTWLTFVLKEAGVQLD